MLPGVSQLAYGSLAFRSLIAEGTPRVGLTTPRYIPNERAAQADAVVRRQDAPWSRRTRQPLSHSRVAQVGCDQRASAEDEICVVNSCAQLR